VRGDCVWVGKNDLSGVFNRPACECKLFAVRKQEYNPGSEKVEKSMFAISLTFRKDNT